MLLYHQPTREKGTKRSLKNIYSVFFVIKVGVDRIGQDEILNSSNLENCNEQWWINLIYWNKPTYFEQPEHIQNMSILKENSSTGYLYYSTNIFYTVLDIAEWTKLEL